MSRVDIAFRPLVTPWPKPETPADARKWGAFKVSYDQMLFDLDYELEQLGARDVACELDMAPADFRKSDGRPFADVRARSPRVMLTVFLQDVGALRWACDAYQTWQKNLRAISLTLTALRAVDRYDASAGREQYRGFKALPGAGETSEERELSPDQAAAVLIERDPTWASMNEVARLGIVPSLLANRLFAQQVARNAVKATHPDAGGDPAQFRDVQRARAVLSKHFREDV